MGVCDGCLQLKLSIRLYVKRSEKCHLYSVKNHEVGTRAQPTFCQSLLVYDVIVILYVCNVRCGGWVDVR